MGVNTRSVSTLVNNGIAANTNITITKPSGVIAGDVMLAWFAFNSSAGVTVSSTPTGWTKITTGTTNTSGASGGSETNDGGTYSGAFVKVAGASEPANYSWQFSLFTDGACGIIDLTGVDNTTPIQGAAVKSIISGGVAATPIVVPQVGGFASGTADVVSWFMILDLAAKTYTVPNGWDNTTDGWSEINDGTEWQSLWGNPTTSPGATQLAAQNVTPASSSEYQTIQVAITVASTGAVALRPFGVSSSVRGGGGQGGRPRFRINRPSPVGV